MRSVREAFRQQTRCTSVKAWFSIDALMVRLEFHQSLSELATAMAPYGEGWVRVGGRDDA